MSTTGATANPLQPSYLPRTPLGQATYGRAATLSPQQINALGPQQSINQVLAGFQPQARQAQGALNSQLAAMGIVGGGAQGATQDLQGQLASSLAPTLASTIQNSQGMQLGAEQGNQSALNAMTGLNVGAANQMTGTNLQNVMGTNLANQQAANSARSALANYLMQAWQVPLQAQTGIYGSMLGGGAGLAGQEAQNFAVPPPQNLFTMLGL